MRTTIIIFFLFAFVFLWLGCRKKITKYPFDMEGVWYARNPVCGMLMVIEANSKGKTLAYNGHFCNNGYIIHEGKIKYKKNILYLNKEKMTIIEKPFPSTSNDSILAPDEKNFESTKVQKWAVLASMTIEMKNGLGDQEQYVFNKYIDY